MGGVPGNGGCGTAVGTGVDEWFLETGFQTVSNEVVVVEERKHKRGETYLLKKWNSSSVVLIISFFNVFLVIRIKNLMKFRKNLRSVIFSSPRIYYKFASYRWARTVCAKNAGVDHCRWSFFFFFSLFPRRKGKTYQWIYGANGPWHAPHRRQWKLKKGDRRGWMADSLLKDTVPMGETSFSSLPRMTEHWFSPPLLNTVTP